MAAYAREILAPSFIRLFPGWWYSDNPVVNFMAIVLVKLIILWQLHDYNGLHQGHIEPLKGARGHISCRVRQLYNPLGVSLYK